MSETSLVHPLETTVRHTLPSSYRRYRIEQNPGRYEKVEQLYSALDAVDFSTYIDRLEACRSRSWFGRNIETGDVRVFTTTCKLRWCPMCSNARRAWLQKSIGHWLKDITEPKFLTLTLKHSDAPLAVQIRLIYSYFRNLRRSTFWTRKVDGGVWFFQLKKSDSDGLWHPHLHCVLDSDWLLHSQLSLLWERITCGSPVVDIRAVRDPEKSADYVARYATSPANLIHLELSDAVECFRALHGRRICGTWGTARKVPLRPPKCDDFEGWRHIGGWSVVTQCADTHPAAALILKAWQTNSVLAADITMSDVEREITGLPFLKVSEGPEQYKFDFYTNH